MVIAFLWSYPAIVQSRTYWFDAKMEDLNAQVMMNCSGNESQKCRKSSRDETDQP